jgi:hypothetical protein
VAGGPGRAVFLIAGGLIAVFLIAGGSIARGLIGRDQVVRGSVGGLRGESRAGFSIAGGPDVKNRAVLVIVGGWVRDCRVGLVVNSHISA